jgi:hypothetical protein
MMARRQSSQTSGSPELTEDVESLYLDLVRDFYEKGDRQRARKTASKLEAIFAREPDLANSIRGEEIRSLIAELNGNLGEAIRRRESEIRKILELHSLAWGKPSWDFVFRQYDYSDLSDRLDLLAALYANAADWEQATATLRESKDYCEGHGIPFDGQDLLDEFEEERASPKGIVRRAKSQLEQIDNAIRDAYQEVGVPSDQLLSDDDMLGRLFRAVYDRIPEVQLTTLELKQRLLKIRKRRSGRGLPKLVFDRDQT